MKPKLNSSIPWVNALVNECRESSTDEEWEQRWAAAKEAVCPEGEKLYGAPPEEFLDDEEIEALLSGAGRARGR